MNSLKRNNTPQKLHILHKDSKGKSKDIRIKDILVITSDICGLGKSEQIKKRIIDNNKTYFHFPFGGILTKISIFDKLEKLLNEIEIEINKNNKKYKDIAIHLDLSESEETIIINEFFFSFLITRFYKNDENIIYIPKDIHIYIEIPNCFEDYLSKFSILKIFDKENITFENMSPLNYPNEIINQFKNILGINSNQGTQEFVKKYIGVPKYSYYQINIFVKLFVSVYRKLSLLKKGKDITDKCIQEFSKYSLYFINGGFAKLLTGMKKIDKKNFINILSEVYENDLNNIVFPSPLTFIIQEKNISDELYTSENVSNTYKSTKYYLKLLKKILDLPYSEETLLSIIEEKNNYVITNDNFKKMVLLIYLINANIPVIIMGETGCGKTSLITKLNQIVNGGKITVIKINIHSGITDEILCERIEQINKEAEDLKVEGKELWVLFDKVNTCLSLPLLTQIFINRSYNGKKINDNIRLIGTCNPFRKRKGNEEKYGLNLSDDNELVYSFNPLPQSLLYYFINLGVINKIDEKNYIHSIIDKLFTKEEKCLHEITRDAISECHIFLRKKYDHSFVSLRDIERFSKCVEFFKSYFKIKNKYEKRDNNEKNNKIRSIICSIYLCYYLRLTTQKLRINFEDTLKPILLKLVNNEANIDEKGRTLMEQIKIQDLKNEIENRSEGIINNFSDFLRIEQDYLIDQIELDKGIYKNALLKENIFSVFISVITTIPLIIMGKPDTGKSLSAQIIYNSMKGKYSKNKFFKQFPQINQIYFQGSKSTQPEDVKELFKKAEAKLKIFQKK